jgi:hypothetical protein
MLPDSGGGGLCSFPTGAQPATLVQRLRVRAEAVRAYLVLLPRDRVGTRGSDPAREDSELDGCKEDVTVMPCPRRKSLPRTCRFVGFARVFAARRLSGSSHLRNCGARRPSAIQRYGADIFPCSTGRKPQSAGISRAVTCCKCRCATPDVFLWNQ